MLFDAQNLFSDPVLNDSPTAVGSTDSTNIIDLGVTRDVGDAVTENLYLNAQVVTAFTSGGSATLQLQVSCAPDSSGLPGSWTVLYQSPAVAVASLVQGYNWFRGSILSQSGTATNPTAYRFLKLTYVIGTAAMTAGAIKAGLSPALDFQPTYQRAYTA